MVTVDPSGDAAVVAARAAGDGASIGLAPAPGIGVGLATDADVIAIDDWPRALDVLREIEAVCGPRWVWWSIDTPAALLRAGLRVGRCWDVATVDRLLAGRWRTDVARSWARAHGLDPRTVPRLGQLGLLDVMADAGADVDDPVQPDGHLRPEWVAGGWAETASRAAVWADLALRTATRQREMVARVVADGDVAATARAESTAELLCAELAHDGLPIDVATATDLIAGAVGPRPTSVDEEVRRRAERDRAVLAHAWSTDTDLRNPAQVKAMLARTGLDLPDTRAWRLEAHRDRPLVAALLEWRKAERIATTFGYGWLDQHVDGDGRLRGAWSSCDGAAGRMTAQAGLHNLPAELRPAVAADAGHRFVRADLGQIEPRVLAAISADPALIAATADDDLYQPVARRLGVERSVAKVAVLAAMYGQTSGVAGQALRGMDAAYPVAMAYLRRADEQGQAGLDIRTAGGRLVRMSPDVPPAARGRYARNAVVQGAAAELFKVWALTVRARVADLDAHIVLCLHDELLIHVPIDHAGEAAERVHAALAEAAARWRRGTGVRFVAELSIVERWSDVD
jgi:DNA polymerase-1